MDEPAPPLVTVYPAPEALTGWMAGLLAKSPGERFRVAADARAALAALPDAPPNGAARWTSKPQGVHATIVNGVPIVIDGELQSDAGLPGHVLSPS